MSRLKQAGDWIATRLGHPSWLQPRTVEGRAGWSRVFGPLLLVLLAVEGLTGIGLSLFYAPTSTDAWASVAFIQQQVVFGWFLRGLHRFTGDALLIVGACYLGQILVTRAYRAPRELKWITGVGLVLALLLASHTGYLLPADLRAYWASQVLLGIAGTTPGIGPFAQTVLEGGFGYGNLTLTHFYSMHVLLIPLLIGVMLVLHRIKPSPLAADRVDVATEPYAPKQLTRDLIAALVVLGVLGVVTVLLGGAELHAPADPAVEFVARPEWYFIPIFQLRHVFTGDIEFIATMIIPGIITGLVMAMPFLDRSTRAHRLIVRGAAIGAVVFVGVTAASEIADRRDPEVKRINRASARRAEQSLRLSEIGVPITGPLDLYKNDPVVWGARVFTEECASCHQPCDKNPYEGDVCLEGYGSRTWLTKFMKAPQGPHFFGNTDIDEMEAWSGKDDDLKALVEFLFAQSERPGADAELAKKGQQVYGDEGCESCHAMDGVGTGDAPDLQGYGSEAWLAAFIRKPDAPRFYGELNQMDAFPHEKLANDELASVVAFLRSQTDEDAKFP